MLTEYSVTLAVNWVNCKAHPKQATGRGSACGAGLKYAAAERDGGYLPCNFWSWTALDSAGQFHSHAFPDSVSPQRDRKVGGLLTQLLQVSQVGACLLFCLRHRQIGESPESFHGRYSTHKYAYEY